MANDFPHELLDDAAGLSQYRGWSEDVYRDFLDVRRGTMTVGEFHNKYTHRRAILSLDMTGFTFERDEDRRDRKLIANRRRTTSLHPGVT